MTGVSATLESSPTRWERSLDKLGQRETWPYIGGIALGAILVIGTAVNLPGLADLAAHDVAMLVSIIGAMLGTGATAQIKRGQQRGEQAAQAGVDAIEEMRAMLAEVQGHARSTSANSAEALRAAQHADAQAVATAAIVSAHAQRADERAQAAATAPAAVAASPTPSSAQNAPTAQPVVLHAPDGTTHAYIPYDTGNAGLIASEPPDAATPPPPAVQQIATAPHPDSLPESAQ